jgi:hypothetical protein
MLNRIDYFQSMQPVDRFSGTIAELFPNRESFAQKRIRMLRVLAECKLTPKLRSPRVEAAEKRLLQIRAL